MSMTNKPLYAIVATAGAQSRGVHAYAYDFNTLHIEKNQKNQIDKFTGDFNGDGKKDTLEINNEDGTCQFIDGETGNTSEGLFSINSEGDYKFTELDIDFDGQSDDTINIDKFNKIGPNGRAVSGYSSETDLNSDSTAEYSPLSFSNANTWEKNEYGMVYRPIGGHEDDRTIRADINKDGHMDTLRFEDGKWTYTDGLKASTNDPDATQELDANNYNGELNLTGLDIDGDGVDDRINIDANLQNIGRFYNNKVELNIDYDNDGDYERSINLY